MSDAEEEIESNALLHEQFKIGEVNETPTVFILPGDNEVGLTSNGRLDDLNDPLEQRPLFDERLSDYEDGERSNERELLRSSMRDPPCPCFSCKSDRGRHEKRRNSECHSHCNHRDHHDHHDRHDRGSFHGDCSSERCHSHKETPCHSDSCFGSHCSKGSEHGSCQHNYHDSHRGCHDQLCGMHCHSSRCHGDSCYQKYDWRDYMMDEEEHRIRGKSSALHKQMYDKKFAGERGGHRNPFDSYQPPFADNMFIPPDPLLMNYTQRRTPRSSSVKDKQHHAERAGGYRVGRRQSDFDLAPLDASSLTKNVTSFKGGSRSYESGMPNTRQGGRRDILTAPGSAIRRMKELVSKYSDRHGKEGDEMTMLNRQENMELEENDLHGVHGDQGKAEAYVCHICGKEFAWAITLKRHMLIHTGVRQYQCNICNKAFTRSHHLKRHMTVHTGEKPYVCHICNKAYSRSDRLSSHMNNHEGYVSNKKRGRMPAKTVEDKPVHLKAEKPQESTVPEANNNSNASIEANLRQHHETELGSTSKGLSGERQWVEPPSLIDSVPAAQAWKAAEDAVPGFRIVTSEQMPWFSNALEQGKEEKIPSEATGKEQNEDEVIQRGQEGDGKGKNAVVSQEYSKPDDFPMHNDEGEATKTSMPSSGEAVTSSAPYQGFSLSRTEKDTLSKFKIHSPEIRPAEFRPPEFFGPPGFGPQRPSGPGFIPGNMLDAKQSSIPPFSIHGSMFRHDSKSGTRTSPLGHDPRGPNVPFLSSDQSKFGYSSLLDARSEFISKQRMSHPPLFFHDMPHEMNRPDDTMLHQKSDDREVKYGSEVLGNYHNSRKEDGHADSESQGSGEHGSGTPNNDDSGMQSKFKGQLGQQRDMKMPMDVKPFDPHYNLFIFRHMVHQPGRPRQNSENSGQKRVLPRTFVCRTCNKAFTRSHHLRRHELIHSGQKPFKCTICGRAFNRTDHLNLHLATHYQSANGPRSYNKDSTKSKKKEADSAAAQLDGGALVDGGAFGEGGAFEEGAADADGVAEKEVMRFADDGRQEGNDPTREEYPVTVLQGNPTIVKTESGMVMEGFEMENSSAETTNVSKVDNIRSEPSEMFNIISSM